MVVTTGSCFSGAPHDDPSPVAQPPTQAGRPALGLPEILACRLGESRGCIVGGPAATVKGQDRQAARSSTVGQALYRMFPRAVDGKGRGSILGLYLWGSVQREIEPVSSR